MSFIARNDQSIIGQWWNEVDRGMIAHITFIMLVGWFIVYSGTAQNALQESQMLLSYSFEKALVVFAGLLLMLGLSLITPDGIERLTYLGFAGAILFLMSIFIFGTEVNSATRWVNLPGVPFGLQPSEFAKPFLVLAIAKTLASARQWGVWRALLAATACYAMVALLLIAQPDYSQTAMLFGVFAVMLFLAGLPLLWIGGVIAISPVFFFAAYLNVGYFRDRIDNFVSRANGTDGDRRDQVDMAHDAMSSGGLTGNGMGEGTWKNYIPEAQNDMPIAIIGDEMGLFGTLGVCLLLWFVWWRAQLRFDGLSTDYRRLAAVGLSFLLLAQALVNILYTIGLLPPTGITLPFFSDGGSSLLASAIVVGLILALTRQRGVEA